MERSDSEGWAGFFKQRIELLNSKQWRTMGQQVADELEALGQATLKRFVRGCFKKQEGEIDPWRLELTLRHLPAPAATTVRFTRSPLWRTEIPLRGLTEPEIHLRALALARSILESLDADEPELKDDLRAVDGAREVWWWLTGEGKPKPRNPQELRVVARFAEAVDHALGPLRLLSTAARADRKRNIDTWLEEYANHQAKTLKSDPFKAEFLGVAERCQPLTHEAINLVVTIVKQGGPSRDTSGRAATLLNQIWSTEPGDESELAPLALWCAQARAVGILGTASDEATLAGVRDRVARQLIDSLEKILPSQRAALPRPPADFAFWQAFPALLRERLDAGAVDDAQRLLDLAADTGAWTGGIVKRLRVIYVLLRSTEGLDGECLAQRFVTRLAYTTGRERNRPPERVWKDGLKRYSKLVGDAPHVGELRQWWEPTIDAEVPAFDAAAETAGALAQRDLETDPNLAGAGLLAWWQANADAVLCPPGKRKGKKSPIRELGGLLEKYVAASAPPTCGESAGGAAGVAATGDNIAPCFCVDCLEGRHGEMYVVPRLFDVAERSVSMVLNDDIYPVPVDQRRKRKQLRQALDRMRRQAQMGRASRGDVLRLRRRLSALASQRFWANLGNQCRHRDALEVAAADFDFPWELVPVPTGQAEEADAAALPLALQVPVRRQRSAGDLPALGDDAEGDKLRNLLVLYDPAHGDAQDEAETLDDIWCADDDREAFLVDTVRELRQLADEEIRFDVIHYAGHQGPADDATPSLSLKGDRLPILELVDLTHAQPPRLLFLNACSTLSATKAVVDEEDDDDAKHTMFGVLEPLLRSPIPAIIGTLWDMNPPKDCRFVREFYQALMRNPDPAAAIHQARLEVSRSPAWAPWWPAYVLVSR